MPFLQNGSRRGLVRIKSKLKKKKKRQLIKAGSWTDVSSVLSLHDVDSEFSLIRFLSY